MFFRAAVIAAAVATANGIVLPNSLEPAAPLPNGVNHVIESRLVKVDCPACPFYDGKSQDGKDSFLQIPNYLVMNFTINGNKLLMNDRQVYPVSMPPPLHKADQVPETVNLVDYVVTETISQASGRPNPFHDVRLGTAMLLNKMERKSDHLTLVEIRLRIGEIEGQRVHVPESLKLDLIEYNGRTYMRDIALIPQAQEIEASKECNTWPILCQYRAMFAGTKPRMGCHHKHKHHKQHGAHSHAYKSRLHRAVHRIAMFAKNVGLPMLAGALAGITVGLAAVVIVQAMTMLWQRMTGRGYIQLEQEDFPADIKELPVYDEVVLVSEKETVQ